VPFETAIIERYRRRESSVEEALVEMYLTGVSVFFVLAEFCLSAFCVVTGGMATGYF